MLTATALVCAGVPAHAQDAGVTDTIDVIGTTPLGAGLDVDRVAGNVQTATAAQIREQAQANADAIRLHGEAEGRAIAAKAKAFQDNPGYTNLIAVERWNGTLPHTMLPGSALPFISIPQGETPSTAPAAPRPAAASAAPRPQ